MITGKKEDLDKMIEEYHCPDHDNALTVAWHAKENAYVIRCGSGHYPEEITREPSRTEQFKRGQLQKVDPLFNLLPNADLATGELLTPETIQFLVDYARRYGLDAYRGHVVYMYGKPYIGLDGYLYYAHKEKIPYQLRSRPLGEDEHKTYVIEKDDYAWTCEVVMLATQQSFTGLGVVTRGEITEMSKKKPGQLRSPVVAAHPWQIAQKRAEWQALRRAFPIGETEEVNE